MSKKLTVKEEKILEDAIKTMKEMIHTVVMCEGVYFGTDQMVKDFLKKYGKGEIDIYSKD
jgi:hypothetical protein